MSFDSRFFKEAIGPTKKQMSIMVYIYIYIYQYGRAPVRHDAIAIITQLLFCRLAFSSFKFELLVYKKFLKFEVSKRGIPI